MTLSAAVASEPLVLPTVELRDLQRYVAALAAGGTRDGQNEDALADVDYAGLRVTLQAVAASDPQLPAAAQGALLALLDRQSRTAQMPWPAIQLYAPELARLLSDPAAEDHLTKRLFSRLTQNGGTRQGWELAVRLTPAASLQYLIDAQGPARLALLEAWNRRLHQSPEARPIPGLAELAARLAATYGTATPESDREALLIFMAGWPALRPAYTAAIAATLAEPQPERVVAALRAQARAPVLVERDGEVLARFPADDTVWDGAMRAYLADTQHNHAATLRALYAAIPAEQVRRRFLCLQAMASHPAGNGALAAAAAAENPLEFMTVAAAILAHDPPQARQAVTAILARGGTGLDEALRLASDLKLTGFTAPAIKILETEREPLLKASALRYLELADSATKRRLLPWLQHADSDVRLAAIEMYRSVDLTNRADLDVIAPALISVALHDPSMGHRQEALFALARWRAPNTASLFRDLLRQYPTLVAQDKLWVTEDTYWQYRFRLLALMGLTMQGDATADSELLAIHHAGGAAERMDVLLAYGEIGRAPDAAFEDLRAGEMKVVATAVNLLREHGTPAQRQRMQAWLTAAPLWSQFAAAGIDDHRIFQRAGLAPE